MEQEINDKSSELAHTLDPGLVERRERVGSFLAKSLEAGIDHSSVRSHFDNVRYAEGLLDSADAFSDATVEHPHSPEELLPIFEEELELAEAAQKAIEEPEATTK